MLAESLGMKIFAHPALICVNTESSKHKPMFFVSNQEDDEYHPDIQPQELISTWRKNNLTSF